MFETKAVEYHEVKYPVMENLHLEKNIVKTLLLTYFIHGKFFKIYLITNIIFAIYFDLSVRELVV